MSCIICFKEHSDETVEHIIPRTLGNIHYILPKGKVCGKCNNRFARFENVVLSSPHFIHERKRMGLLSKKKIIGHSELSETAITKFVLKMGFEGLFYSRKGLWKKINFDNTFGVLNGRIDVEKTPEIIQSISEKWKSIPGIIDRFRLSMNQLSLQYSIHKENEVWVKFRFGKIQVIRQIGLLN